MKVKRGLYFVLTLSPILLLSGCEWFGGAKKERTPAASQVAKTGGFSEGILATWGDGNGMITQKEFDEKLELIMKEKPELRGMAEAFMPMLKGQLLTSLVYEKIIGKWVKDNKLDQSAKYKDRLDNVMAAATNAVNVEFFTKELEVNPSAADLKNYYEENKDRIALVSRGGVKAVGVKFDSEEKAKVLLEKAKAKAAEFEKMVTADKDLSKDMQDFNYVNQFSRGIAKAVVDKIAAMKRFPTVQLIKEDDKTFWVVGATEKKPEEYRSFDEVKDTVENMVKQTKQGEAIQQKLEDLKARYGVTVKEDVFMPKQPEEPVVPKKEEKKPVKPATKAV